MPQPPTINPARRRVHRRRKTVAPAAPVLVSASFAAPVLRLVFDRAVDAAGFVGGAALVVDDAAISNRWEATVPAIQIDANTVDIELLEVETVSVPHTRMTASAGNGIVAAGDGAAWAGVTDLELPFPA